MPAISSRICYQSTDGYTRGMVFQVHVTYAWLPEVGSSLDTGFTELGGQSSMRRLWVVQMLKLKFITSLFDGERALTRPHQLLSNL